MDAATIINRASAKRLSRRAAIAGLLASAVAQARRPHGAPGGGGGGGGVIPTNLASMSSGAFLEVTLPQIWNINSGVGSTIFEYVTRVAFDRANQKMRFCGISHGTPVPTYCEYSINTDVAYQETFSDGESGPRHSGDGCDYDQNGNYCYWHYNGSSNYQFRNDSSGWSTNYSNPLLGSTQWANVVYHEGQAKVINATEWGTWGFTAAAPTTYTHYRDNGAGTDMGGSTQTQGIAGFNPKNGGAYFGGGNFLCTVNSSGTWSQIGNPPVTIGYPGYMQGSGINVALLPPGNSANDLSMLAYDTIGGTITVYPYTSSTDTWGSPLSMDSGWRSYLLGAQDAQYVVCAIRETSPGAGNGGMVFMRQISAGNSTMDANVYLWKH